MKTKKLVSLLLSIGLCVMPALSALVFAGCSADDKLFDVCSSVVKAWAKDYDSSAPGALTVYIDNGGTALEPQQITDPQTINQVFAALSAISVTGRPMKGPIDFSISPVTTIYSFRSNDGITANFTFLDKHFALGDPIFSDGLLYACSGVSRLFSIDGIVMPSDENTEPIESLEPFEPEPIEPLESEPLETEPIEPLEPEPQSTLKLTKYDGGFFSVLLPEGWQLHTMGQYSTFGFRAWDTQNPDYEIFYYGNISPFLKSNAAKQWNESMSGMTPENSTYHLFADTPVADENDVSTVFYNLYAFRDLVDKYTGVYFDSGISLPTLRSFSVIEQMPITTALSSACSSEALIYASLQSDSGTNCYGKFSASLFSAPPVIYDNIDMATVSALSVTGVIAPQGDFAQVEQTLSQAVFSLTFTEEYVDKALKDSSDAFNQAMVNNATTQAIYDAYNAAWDAYIRN